MRRSLLTAFAKGDPLAGVSIGDSFRGGFLGPIIDTTKSNIIAADASQTGLRYALIVAGISLENTNLEYEAGTSSAPAAARTRWDGLTATTAMTSSAYPAADYCAGLAYPSDDASPWYLPAMDELAAIYWYLRPTSESNFAGTLSGSTFPGGTQPNGYNPSSDPTVTGYTTTSPAQTTVAAFRAGGAQAFSAQNYWSSTEYSSASGWVEEFGGAFAGLQSGFTKTNGTYVRPVRRLVLS